MNMSILLFAAKLLGATLLGAALLATILYAATSYARNKTAARATRDVEEAAQQLQAQADECNAALSALLESLSSLPSVEGLEQYTGRRITTTVRAQGVGFEYLPIDDKYAPYLELPGLYAIMVGRHVLYVGKAEDNLRTRLRTHAKNAQSRTGGGSQQLFLYEAMRQYKDSGLLQAVPLEYVPAGLDIAAREKVRIAELNPVCNIQRR